MTDHGGKGSNHTKDEVAERLEDESDGKTVERFVAAREYLDGQSPAQISEKDGWPKKTNYSWFDRLGSHGLDDAHDEESPPGRPPPLSDDEFDAFRAAVRNPPEDAGFDEPAWSTALTQQFLREKFGREFSRRHVRRLLAKSGRATRSPQPAERDGA